MGKINMGIFYGKKYNPRNRTFSLENGENFIEGTGHCYSKRKEAKLPLFLAPCFLQLIFWTLFFKVLDSKKMSGRTDKLE